MHILRLPNGLVICLSSLLCAAVVVVQNAEHYANVLERTVDSVSLDATVQAWPELLRYAGAASRGNALNQLELQWLDQANHQLDAVAAQLPGNCIAPATEAPAEAPVDDAWPEPLSTDAEVAQAAEPQPVEVAYIPAPSSRWWPVLSAPLQEKHTLAERMPAQRSGVYWALQGRETAPAALAVVEAVAPVGGTEAPGAVETVATAEPTEAPEAVETVAAAEPTEQPEAVETVATAEPTEAPGAVETVATAEPTEQPEAVETVAAAEPVKKPEAVEAVATAEPVGPADQPTKQMPPTPEGGNDMMPQGGGAVAAVVAPASAQDKQLAQTPPMRYRIMLVGDSLMEDLALCMVRNMNSRKGIEFVVSAKFSTGLCRPEQFNWPAHMREQVAKRKPDMVVFMIGGNDGMPIREGRRSVPPGSRAWKEAYMRKMEELVSIAREAEAEIIWVEMPAVGGRYNKVLHDTQQAQREYCETNGITSLPTDPFLSGEWGRFELYGDYHGTKVRLRHKDQTHLSKEGNDLVLEHLLPLMEARMQAFYRAHPERHLTPEELKKISRVRTIYTCRYTPAETTTTPPPASRVRQ